MATKVIFFYSQTKFSAKLTKIFTGSFCYHVGWLVTNPHTGEEEVFDMNLLRRVRSFSEVSLHLRGPIKIVEVPVDVSWSYLYGKLKSDENVYGFKDYLLFGFRKIFHLFGASTPNAQGVICSEMVYNDAVENGHPAVFTEVPSPADLENEWIHV